MECGLCKNKLTLKRGNVEFDSRSLGRVLVPDLKFHECEMCGDKLLSPKESDKAIEYIANIENQLIKTFPIGEFITANEAAEILKITKQAFSKHPKIKRGLIYSTKIGNRKYYHEESVRLFKKNKNGKFKLTGQEDIVIETETAADVNYTVIGEYKIESTYSVGGQLYDTIQASGGICTQIPNIQDVTNQVSGSMPIIEDVTNQGSGSICVPTPIIEEWLKLEYVA